MLENSLKHVLSVMQSEVEYEYFADRFSVRCQSSFSKVLLQVTVPCTFTLHALANVLHALSSPFLAALTCTEALSEVWHLVGRNTQ